jgi:hypothetical protein
MAKVSSEVSSPPKPTSSSNASTIDNATSLVIKREVVGLDAFLTNMQGDTKIHVEAFMAKLGAAQDLLEEKERLEREAADEIASLTQAHEEEHVTAPGSTPIRFFVCCFLFMHHGIMHHIIHVFFNKIKLFL